MLALVLNITMKTRMTMSVKDATLSAELAKERKDSAAHLVCGATVC